MQSSTVTGIPRQLPYGPSLIPATLADLPAGKSPASARAIAPKKPLRANAIFLSRFKLIWVVQSPAKEYFASLSPQISGYFRVVSSRQEGRIAIVTNAGRDVVDATASARKVIAGRGQTRERLAARKTTALAAYGKTAWS